jgi:hypothetical protein
MYIYCCSHGHASKVRTTLKHIKEVLRKQKNDGVHDDNMSDFK